LAKGQTLEELRKNMEEVTLEIFRLCGERIRFAEKIGKIKAEENMPIKDSKVEEELRKEVLRECQKFGLKTDFCNKLLKLLLDESKKVQREVLRSEKHKQ